MNQPILRNIAHGVSLAFHPLLIPTYMLVLLLLINPYLFGINSIGEQAGRLTLLLVFLYTFFMPTVCIVVMRFLGMIDSFQMPDKTDRIGPYLLTGLLYLWVFYNFLNTGQVPTAFTAFMLGVVIALFLAFFVNIFSKISAHAVGVGGLVAMVLITLLRFSFPFFSLDLGTLGAYNVSVGIVLLLVIFVAGLVGSARLLLNAHEPIDLYGGYLVGFTAQMIAYRFFF